MTRVLVVNAGSSSLKIRLLGSDDAVVADHSVDRWDHGDRRDLAAELPDSAGVDAIGHRVVHGGADLTRAVLIDDDVERQIEALLPLAPLHQERALAGISAARAAFPGVPAVACFDTAYHATLSTAVATYALPVAWNSRWGLRRYGFHGLSHSYAARLAAELTGRDPAGIRVVTCHLGAGASLCASRGGRSVDTTMGFTPLEGLVMATRSGSVDPGLLLWLQTDGGMSAAELRRGLEEHSGLAGLTDGSGDMRDVLRGRDKGDDRAVLAFDVYTHRLARETAAMTAALGGLDALVFTAGVGENAPAVRAAVAEQLQYLGVAIDPQRNEHATGDGDADISAPGSDVATLVIEAREDLEIARQTRAVLGDVTS